MPPKAAAKRQAPAKVTTPKSAKKPKQEPEPEEEEESEEEENEDDQDEPEQKPQVQKSGSTPASKGAAKESGASILRKNDKNNMAYPKGTYLIRLADLDTDKKEHIWRVDNHQLLQKYERQTADDNSRYQRTNRYTGWFCSEGFKFLELRVLEKENKEEKVRVKYPKDDELEQAKTKAETKQKELEEAEE